MNLNFEYGHGFMKAELPDNTDIFIPGETVADPPHIPEELLIEKTLYSIRHPIEMEPIRSFMMQELKKKISSLYVQMGFIGKIPKKR